MDELDRLSMHVAHGLQVHIGVEVYLTDDQETEQVTLSLLLTI